MLLHFTTSNRIGSRLIRAFDSGPASHVGIESPLAPGLVIDSTWTHGGVLRWPLAEWMHMDDRSFVRTVDVPLPSEAVALSWAADQIGKPYDKSAIFGMSVLRDWQDSNAWYCSELAIGACLQGGLTLATRQAEIGLRLCLELAHAWSIRGVDIMTG